MDVTLQNHGAKHIYRVPDGLRELCTDITREVLRCQPGEIYHFIADYVDALLITRENARVAVKVVNNILRGSETIMNILYRTGLSIEQIASAAPRIQRAFRAYLDILDGQQEPCETEFDRKSIISLTDILKCTGIDYEHAVRAATIIQAAFRGHRTRMILAESQGKVQWQRALINTVEILKKAGVPKEEIAKSLPTIQFAYKGYYTQRKLKIQTAPCQQKPKKTVKKYGTTIEPGHTIQAVAWLEMIYEDSGMNVEIANKAALIIQRAYKKYRLRTHVTIRKVVSSRTLVVDAIVDSLRQKIFDDVTSREDIPDEFGTREEMQKASEALQRVYKDHLRRARISAEGEEEEGEEIGQGLDEIIELEGEEEVTETKPEELESSEIVEKDEHVPEIEETKVEDAETKVEDAETKVEDAGTKVEDAGTKVEDAGTKLEDAGTKVEDAGTKVEDAETVAKDPAGEPINVEEGPGTTKEEKVKQDEHKEQEEQEVPHEATPASDTAG